MRRVPDSFCSDLSPDDRSLPGETWPDGRRRFLDATDAGALRFGGWLPDGGRWTCRILYLGAYRDFTLLDVSRSDGSSDWKVFGMDAVLDRDPPTEERPGRRRPAASTKSGGLVVRVFDRPEMHALPQVESLPGIDVQDWHRLAGEIAKTVIEQRGEEILTGILREARSHYSHMCTEYFASADALAAAEAGLAVAQEEYAAVLRRLPEKIVHMVGASDVVEIAAAKEYVVDSPLGALLFRPMSDGQGFRVAATKRRSALRRIGELSDPDRQITIQRDGTIRSAGFRFCSTWQGEEVLREAALRLVGATPWIFDREDLGVAAGRLLKERDGVGDATDKFCDALMALSEAAQTLCLARSAYVEGVVDPNPELTEMPAMITVAYEVTPPEGVEPTEDAETEEASGPSPLW